MAHVLVVDDEGQMRKLIRLVMEQEGHTVVEAPNGKKAIQHLQEAEIDLVISDIVMPDMDGLELIRGIRRNHPGIKILAISGAGKEGPGLYLNMAEHFGADEILMKPFSPDQLIKKVSAVLGN
jgi:two-component system, chemotaxis family, chemotaxis protein CheY